jgi:hypothetical protein
MTKRISVDRLDPMHEALAKHFADILEFGEELVVTNRETGEVTKKRVKPSAATLNQIRQFLKDNGVIAAPTSKRITNIVAGLPFAGTDDDDEDAQPQGATH